MTKAELVDQVAATVQLPKAQTDALFQSLRTLDQQRDIRDVLALTIAPTGTR